MNQSGFRSGNGGFTLLEMLIVLGIAAVMLTLATGGYMSWMSRIKVQDVAEDLKRSITRARGESIRYGGKVILCSSTDGENCSTRWSDGWIVFLDQNLSSDYDDGEILIGKKEVLGSNPDVEVIHRDSGSSLNKLFYNYRGYLSAPVSVSLERGLISETFTVSRTGHTQ